MAFFWHFLIKQFGIWHYFGIFEDLGFGIILAFSKSRFGFMKFLELRTTIEIKINDSQRIAITDQTNDIDQLSRSMIIINDQHQ